MDKHQFGNTGDIQTKMTSTKIGKKRIKSSGKITVSGVTQSVTSFNNANQHPHNVNEDIQYRNHATNEIVNMNE